jgi:hypothetical protein
MNAPRWRGANRSRCAVDRVCASDGLRVKARSFERGDPQIVIMSAQVQYTTCSGFSGPTSSERAVKVCFYF